MTDKNGPRKFKTDTAKRECTLQIRWVVVGIG